MRGRAFAWLNLAYRFALHVLALPLRALRGRGDAEVPSTEIGHLATDALRELDQLAYIRFASVYHAYDDIETLQREVDRLIRGRTE